MYMHLHVCDWTLIIDNFQVSHKNAAEEWKRLLMMLLLLTICCADYNLSQTEINV